MDIDDRNGRALLLLNEKSPSETKYRLQRYILEYYLHAGKSARRTHHDQYPAFQKNGSKSSANVSEIRIPI